MTVWTSVVGPGLQNANKHLRFGVLIKHYLLKDVISGSPLAADRPSAPDFYAPYKPDKANGFDPAPPATYAD